MIEGFLPPTEDLDYVLSTEKWRVNQAESEALGLNAAAQIEIIAPLPSLAGKESVSAQEEEEALQPSQVGCVNGGCTTANMDW